MITRTVAILVYAAPDQDRKVYAVHLATARTRTARALDLQGEPLAFIHARYADPINVRALAESYATPAAPVWEKL